MSLCLKDVRFLFFGNSTTDFKSINFENVGTFPTLPKSFFNSTKSNAIYIFGWNSKVNDDNSNTVISAYLTRKTEFNVILIDWSDFGTAQSFLMIPYDIPTVTNKAIEIINFLKLNDFDLSRTHLVGHSFGVLIAGNIGRIYKNIPRITALDPPNGYGYFDIFYLPHFFIFPPILTRLSLSDAKFIDVIHSNAYEIGDGETRGHVEFWPNGGTIQTGCLHINFTSFEYAGEKLTFFFEIFKRISNFRKLQN